MNTDPKSRLKAVLKRFRFLYKLYYYVMTLFVNVIKLFVSTDEKLILFVSFGGRRCNDSPKAIYDYMLNDPRFNGYKLVWGFLNPEEFPNIENKVKLDTLQYYIVSLKARCWITNVLIERGLSYSGKHTFYLYTGHGSPIKKVGTDENNNKHFTSAARSHFDASLAQSEFEKEIRSRVLNIKLDNVYITGAPTNDILVNYDNNYWSEIRTKIGIKPGKKAILYAPTFREYRQYGTFDMPKVDFSKWHQILGDDYIILYRAHPIANCDNQMKKDWFIDVTTYDSIEPLMIASDILVSDYSGLIADYSIMDKPIYLWTYDFEQYERARGLYFDIRKELPDASEEDVLLKLIKEGYLEEQKKQVDDFKKKYATEYGNGAKNASDIIYENICS